MTGELKLSHITCLIFCLVYPELCQSLFLYLGGGNGSFRKIGRGDGITGLSKMCCVMLRCNALYCIVMSYHVFVSCCTHRTVYRFVSVCVKEPVKCTAAPFVNILINVFHKNYL